MSKNSINKIKEKRKKEYLNAEQRTKIENMIIYTKNVDNNSIFVQNKSLKW